MNIVHIDLTGTYNENMTYQGNILPHCHAISGHIVTVITTCYMWDKGDIVYVDPEDRYLSDGIRLIRLDYKFLFNKKVTKSIRAVKNNLSSILELIKPDIIMFHGPQSIELVNVAKYCKKHINTTLYVDNHADSTNSANGIISKWILHRTIYKLIIKAAYDQIDRIYYISYECKEFLNKNYNLPNTKMEFLPLGGLLPDDGFYINHRQAIRNNLLNKEDDILIFHAGKFDSSKRTEVLLNGFSQIKDNRLKLILCGSFDDETQEVFNYYSQNDERISYLGWVSGEKLLKYLCACDLYIQPGTQSAILQSAVCCRASVAVFPYKSYKYLLGDAAFYIDTSESITRLLTQFLNNDKEIINKKQNLKKIALNLLDYKKQAEKLANIDCGDEI